MPYKSIVIFFALIFICFSFQKSSVTIDTSFEVMFYNVENLFDTIDDPHTNDNDYLPNGKNNWNTQKYNSKLANLSKVIHAINQKNIPELIGVCEIENRNVLKDLINVSKLNKHAIAHFESPDDRGIDVALLYDSTRFKLINTKPIYVQLCLNSVYLNQLDPNKALAMINAMGGSKTRNILLATLLHQQDTYHVLVNHFPSRMGGKEQSEIKRIMVAEVLKTEIDKLQTANRNAKIIVMGDFNDEPTDQCLQTVLRACGADSAENCALYNPYLSLMKAGKGTYKYHGKMDMLDQIMISFSLRKKNSVSSVFDPDWLKQTGKWAGYPLRTFGGKIYLNGYSDHFAVITTFTN